MNIDTDPTRRPRGTDAGRRHRTATVLVALVALLLGLAGTAQARTTVDRGTHAWGLFYGDFDEEVLLFAGGTAEQFCVYDEPVHEARFQTRHDGTFVLTVAPKDPQPLYLYSTPLGAPEFLDEQCPLLFDGDDATTVQAPFAVGEGHMRLRDEVATDGSVHVVNTSWGTVTTDDGSTWRVRGHADLMVVDGVPVGDPVDFQSLKIVRTGR